MVILLSESKGGQHGCRCKMLRRIQEKMEFPAFEWIRIELVGNEIFLRHGSSGDWGC